MPRLITSATIFIFDLYLMLNWSHVVVIPRIFSGTAAHSLHETEFKQLISEGGSGQIGHMAILLAFLTLTAVPPPFIRPTSWSPSGDYNWDSSQDVPQGSGGGEGVLVIPSTVGGNNKLWIKLKQIFICLTCRSRSRLQCLLPRWMGLPSFSGDMRTSMHQLTNASHLNSFSCPQMPFSAHADGRQPPSLQRGSQATF